MFILSLDQAAEVEIQIAASKSWWVKLKKQNSQSTST